MNDERRMREVFVIRGKALEGLRFDHYNDAVEVIRLDGEEGASYIVEKVYEIRVEYAR